MHKIHSKIHAFLKFGVCGMVLTTMTATAFADLSDFSPRSRKPDMPMQHPFTSGLFHSKIAKSDVVISNEIWSRVRTHFHLEPPTHSQRYHRHIKRLATSQSTVNVLVKNASPYLYFILEEVEKRGMPSEIALLPMIESTFDPNDRSHKGAVGLWQLMPALGRHHGLKQNSAYDGRRDVYESTKVALDHLQYLHKRFNGNWLLALAAYNSGEFRVLNAIKRNRAAHKPTDYWSLPLPKETQDYVPKLLAWVEIVRAPKSYGLSLPNIPNKPVFTRLNTGKAIDISHAAKVANISETQLRKLNPGFKKSMDPKGPFHLVVPIQQASVVQEKLGAKPVPTPAAKKSAAVKTQAKTEPKTEVKTELKSEIEKPSLETASVETAKSSAKTQSTSKKSKSVAKKKSAKSTATAQSSSRMHTVKKGDSIPKICKRYGLNMKKFMAKNGLKSQGTIIRPGQKLKI